MNRQYRQQMLTHFSKEQQSFDVVVVGGGITGAGVAREAAAIGLNVLLVEQRDFAWGTSSRSSKMVHGGLRYLGSGQLRITRDAVHERQRMMAEAPGLIDPLQFIMPHFRRQFPGPRVFQTLLGVYDRIAGKRSRQLLSRAQALQWVPYLTTDNLVAASAFTDAVTDDARLVQRVIEEARRDGATCLNYVAAKRIIRENDRVIGVELSDASANNDATPLEVRTPLVINATGAWADQLQRNSTQQGRIRPLRGSHLVVPFEVLPVSCSVSLFHPRDRRPVFAFPWRGTTVLGTTDLDHDQALSREPGITTTEVDYLLQVAATLFPRCAITRHHILATWAGVRPVVSDGNGKAPSRENREHVFWEDDGLISIAGGKLTTFRLIAREALKRGFRHKPDFRLRPDNQRFFSPPPPLRRPGGLSHLQWERLRGYYGPELPELLETGSLESVPGTDIVWAEVVWAAGHADVIHLDDLLLRRTRLGLILPDGAKTHLSAIRAHCQDILGWNSETWEKEEQRYLDLWHNAYSLPQQRPDGSEAASS